MNHIQNHLNHMLDNEQTTLAHVSDELLAEISKVNLDRRALEKLGRHVLSLISDDLKSGLHARKAVQALMQGGRNG